MIEPTATGLGKSILDATALVRNYLVAVGVHDYAVQTQGQSAKVQVAGRLLSPTLEQAAVVSLYRPETKQGDPRLWITGLQRLAQPLDALAVFHFQNALYVVNLTRQDWASLTPDDVHRARPDLDVLRTVMASRQAPSTGLLARLRKLAEGWLPSIGTHDTAVGRTVEWGLGIPMNASKSPDYNGIELKSRRATGTTRMTLYSQVPDWQRSHLSSSAALVDHHGYMRGDVRKLYCSLTGHRANAQGLKLEVEHRSGLLFATDMNNAAFRVVQWDIGLLQRRLREKHAETFWIDVDTRVHDGRGEFRLKSVEHTSGPYHTRLPELLESGSVGVDFLIKRTGTSVKDKGYLFKLAHGGLSHLFPPSSHYALR
ncbi:MAG: MvaI/BcnI restriction endonuclease family protein [Myxococcales bacterium]|nr:MvaI/BcnI restriction endonuclease family protein [Myxococcales bacterium]